MNTEKRKTNRTTTTIPGPKGTLLTVKAVQVYKDDVILDVKGHKTPVRMHMPTFIALVIKSGYDKTNGMVVLGTVQDEFLRVS